MAAPTPPAVRRERRAFVESELLKNAHYDRIVPLALERWPGTAASTIHRDARLIQRRWRLDTQTRLRKRRDALLAKVSHERDQAFAAGDRSAGAQLATLEARVLGMLAPDTVLVDQRKVILQMPVTQIVATLQRTLLEQGFIDPPKPVVAIVHVPNPPALNGHAHNGNGHVGNGHVNGAA